MPKKDTNVVAIRRSGGPANKRATATRAKTVVSPERQLAALELRRSGATYEAIGQALGITKQAAWELVQRGLASLAEDIRSEAGVVRELELARLDRMQLGLAPKAENGDVRAAEAVLKIMMHRARLLGMDVPLAIGQASGALEVAVRYVETWRSD